MTPGLPTSLLGLNFNCYDFIYEVTVMSTLQEKTISYYRMRESRWGYKLVLGGTKHFGYYPNPTKAITMKRAMMNMEDQLAQALALPAGSRILDAGCGMGRVAVHLAQTNGYHIDGVDLLDFNINEAKNYALKNGQNQLVTFRVGDYTQLPFADDSFDGIYTMETLYHAPDYNVALAELRRVLKPGGRLVLFEYSVASVETIMPEALKAFREIADTSAMHSFPPFIHDEFDFLLQNNGFVNVTTTDITPHVVPMLKRFHQLALVPYYFNKLLRRSSKRYPNTLAGYQVYRYRQYWRYNVVVADKS